MAASTLLALAALLASAPAPAQAARVQAPARDQSLEQTRAELAQLAKAQPALLERIEAIELLGRIGRAADLLLLLELASPAEVESPASSPQGLRSAFERSFQRIVARDRDALLSVGPLLERAPLELVDPIVRAAGVLNSSAAVAALCQALGRDAQADARILSEIERLGRVVPHPIDVDLARVRQRLDDPDPLVRLLAIRCAGSLEDVLAAPRLIACVGEDDATPFAEQAERVLKGLSGMDLAGDSRAWSAWLAKEERWWLEESGDVIDRALSEERETAADAINTASRHRLYRHELARALAPALGHKEPELVQVACSSLVHLGSRTAVPELLPLLDESDERLRKAAYDALRAITGRSLPPDAALWRAMELHR